MTYEAALVDLDGTVYRGERATDGAETGIRSLRDAGIVSLFLSNNPTKRPAAYRDKLAELGIETTTDRILNSVVVAGKFLAANHAGEPVYVIGEQPLIEELGDVDVTVTEDPLRASVVLLSLDRSFHYDHLTDVLTAEKANGPPLYATNPDRTWPIQGREIPDCGAIIGAVEAMLDREIDAVMGKPSQTMVDVAMDRLGAEPETSLMVGDRLETDIVMGNAAGMTTVLVLTGVTSRSDLAGSSVQPDHVIDSLADINSIL
ncbi:MAG: HAD-IIA family hydrolase [Halodesulfurarchaeum sp.]